MTEFIATPLHVHVGLRANYQWFYKSQFFVVICLCFLPLSRSARRKPITTTEKWSSGVTLPSLSLSVCFPDIPIYFPTSFYIIPSFHRRVGSCLARLFSENVIPYRSMGFSLDCVPIPSRSNSVGLSPKLTQQIQLRAPWFTSSFLFISFTIQRREIKLKRWNHTRFQLYLFSPRAFQCAITILIQLISLESIH